MNERFLHPREQRELNYALHTLIATITSFLRITYRCNLYCTFLRLCPENSQFSLLPPLTSGRSYLSLTCHIRQTGRGQCRGISSTPPQDDCGTLASDSLQDQVGAQDRLLAQSNLSHSVTLATRQLTSAFEAEFLYGDKLSTIGLFRRLSTGGPTHH